MKQWLRRRKCRRLGHIVAPAVGDVVQHCQRCGTVLDMLEVLWSLPS